MSKLKLIIKLIFVQINLVDILELYLMPEILTKDVQFDCFSDGAISHSIIGFTNIITRLGSGHVMEH